MVFALLFSTALLILFLLLVFFFPSKTDGLSRGMGWLMIISFGKIKKVLDEKKSKSQSLRMSEGFYNGLASISIQVAIENVLLSYDWERNKIRVWLSPRRDQIYKETRWHCPGSMLRPTDKADDSFTDAFERVRKRELKIENYSKPPVLAGMIMSETPRGMELSLVYLCQLEKEPKGEGQFFDIDELPTNLIKHHLPFIRMALEKYRKTTEQISLTNTG